MARGSRPTASPSAPASNPALEQALGVRTGAAPTRVHVSPRIGILVHVQPRPRERQRHEPESTSAASIARRSATLRGGIGEFRDLLRPDFSPMRRRRPVCPAGRSILSCVGSAVPQPDWSSFDAGTTSRRSARRQRRARRARAVGHADRSGLRRAAQLARVARLDHERGTCCCRVGGLASYDLTSPASSTRTSPAQQQLSLAGDGNRPSTSRRLDRSDDGRRVGGRIATLDASSDASRARERPARLRRPAHASGCRPTSSSSARVQRCSRR